MKKPLTTADLVRDTALIRHLPGKRETCCDDAILRAIVFAGLAAALLGVIYGWFPRFCILPL
jgi:hypothetical protein